MSEELISTALLGTRGTAIRLPSLPDGLAASLPGGSDNSETHFLDPAGAATLYPRAGARTRIGIAGPETCPPDRWRECPTRAADILAQVFAGGLQPLLAEWLQLAQSRNIRPPHRLLPKLLDAAAAKRALQPAISTVIGERGHWLMQFNENWQFSRTSNQSPDDAWHIGNRQQRAEALRTVRQIDAAAARGMIAATWKDDSAEERAPTGSSACSRV